MSNEPTYTVHWPLGSLASLRADDDEKGEAVPGIADLRGKRIAFVADGGFRPDEMDDVLRRELTKSFEGLEFFSHRQFGSIHGGRDEDAVVAALPKRLAEERIDGAIVGIAA